MACVNTPFFSSLHISPSTHIAVAGHPKNRDFISTLIPILWFTNPIIGISGPIRECGAGEGIQLRIDSVYAPMSQSVTFRAASSAKSRPGRRQNAGRTTQDYLGQKSRQREGRFDKTSIVLSGNSHGFSVIALDQSAVRQTIVRISLRTVLTLIKAINRRQAWAQQPSHHPIQVCPFSADIVPLSLRAKTVILRRLWAVALSDI